jgi:hypothetical protein
MKPFSDSGTAEKYRQIGFSPADLSLKVIIGDVSIYAVEQQNESRVPRLAPF